MKISLENAYKLPPETAIALFQEYTTQNNAERLYDFTNDCLTKPQGRLQPGLRQKMMNYNLHPEKLELVEALHPHLTAIALTHPNPAIRGVCAEIMNETALSCTMLKFEEDRSHYTSMSDYTESAETKALRQKGRELKKSYQGSLIQVAHCEALKANPSLKVLQAGSRARIRSYEDLHDAGSVFAQQQNIIVSSMDYALNNLQIGHDPDDLALHKAPLFMQHEMFSYCVQNNKSLKRYNMQSHAKQNGQEFPIRFNPDALAIQTDFAFDVINQTVKILQGNNHIMASKMVIPTIAFISQAANFLYIQHREKLPARAAAEIAREHLLSALDIYETARQTYPQADGLNNEQETNLTNKVRNNIEGLEKSEQHTTHKVSRAGNILYRFDQSDFSTSADQAAYKAKVAGFNL